MSDRILVTGAGGRIATAVRPRLASLCRSMRSVDVREFEPVAANDEVCVADLGDESKIDALLDGVDAVVHMAGYPREADWSTILPANIAASITLWEGAVRAGVQRILYASSNHAVGFYPRDRRIGSDVPPRPDSRYGVSKVFVEALARLHADKHGIRAFGMRIGHCAVQPTDARMLSHWIHPDDMASLIEVGLTADYHCEIVYGASNNSRSWWDNSRAHALGYAPVHSADSFAERLASRVESDPVAARYQGGSFAAAEYVGEPERPASR